MKSVQSNMVKVAKGSPSAKHTIMIAKPGQSPSPSPSSPQAPSIVAGQSQQTSSPQQILMMPAQNPSTTHTSSGNYNFHIFYFLVFLKK